MARLHRLDSGCRWSLLPFCAVGTAAGLLLAVRSDYVKVGGITYPRVLLALTPGPVSDGGGIRPCGAEERSGVMELLRRLLRWLNGRPDKVITSAAATRCRRRCPRQEEAAWIARLEQGSCWPGRRSSSETCGWWCISPAGLRTPASTSRPDLHRHHRPHQGHQHLPGGQEHQAGHLRLPAASRMRSHVPAEKRRQRTEVSFDEPLNTDWDGKELLLSDVLGTEGDVVMRPIEADVDRKLLADAVARLSPGRRTSSPCASAWGGGRS